MLDLKKIIKITNKENHIEMIRQSNKVVESLNRAEIKIPIRNEFLNKYQKSKNKNFDNIIFYDFKKKLYKKDT